MIERRTAKTVRMGQRAQDRVLEREGITAAFGHKHVDHPLGFMLPANAPGGRKDLPSPSAHAPRVWAPPGAFSAPPTFRQSDALPRRTLAPCDGQPNMTSAGSGRLRVWSWWQSDHVSLKDLACVIAATSRNDVDEARRRLELTGHATLGTDGPANPGFATAMERPFQLIWMTLDDYVARSTRWLREEQLHALRTLASSERA